MKTALHGILFGALALTGCQSPTGSSLDAAARGQSQSAGIELKRPSRVYEEGDALFAIMNNSPRVLWFEGQGPELPAYRLKAGSAIGPEQNAPVIGQGGALERFPLVPGASCYFHINSAGAAQPASVGVMFYPSRTATNGFMMWSPPVALPGKQPK